VGNFTCPLLFQAVEAEYQQAVAKHAADLANDSSEFTRLQKERLVLNHYNHFLFFWI
jgi:hypothetical protein